MPLPSPVPPPVMRMRLLKRRSLRNMSAPPASLCDAGKQQIPHRLTPVRNDKSIWGGSMGWQYRVAVYGVAQRSVALQITGYSKAVIRILELGRDAGAGRAARNFHMMPPRSSARCLALAVHGTARIALRRTRIIIRIVPVAAPLVDVVTNVVKAKRIRGVACNPLRAVLPACRIV